MRNKNLKRLVLIALYVALAIVLDYVKEMLPFLNMPKGGSINIATIPIVLVSFHLGILDGCISGFLWLVVSFALALNYPPIGVIEFILDYFIPSTILGISSILGKNGYLRQIAGIVIANAIRMISIILAGVYFWFPKGAAAGSALAWANSLEYNLPYLLATTVMLTVVIPLLYERLNKILNK